MTKQIKTTRDALRWLIDNGYNDFTETDNGQIELTVTCRRCGGSGRYTTPRGLRERCWGCTDTGPRHQLRVDAVAHARKMRNKQTAQERKLRRARVERVANWCGFFRANPDMVEVMRTDHRIVREMRSKVAEWGDLSQGQIGLARKLASEEAKRDSEPKGVVPDGVRQLIDGRVLNVAMKDTPYGETLKMLVEVDTDAGPIRLYGTVPSRYAGPNLKRHDKVAFVGTIKRSNNDESFGFWSRPTTTDARCKHEPAQLDDVPAAEQGAISSVALSYDKQ